MTRKPAGVVALFTSTMAALVGRLLCTGCETRFVSTEHNVQKTRGCGQALDLRRGPAQGVAGSRTDEWLVGDCAEEKARLMRPGLSRGH